MNLTEDRARLNRIVGISWPIIGFVIVLMGIIIDNAAFIALGVVFIALTAAWFRRAKSEE